LDEYKGKVLVIVNTASKCQFTPQFDDLQKLYEQYKDSGLEILGFPCNQFGEQEPGTNEEAATFCKINFDVIFPILAKVNVNGKDVSPLFYSFPTEDSHFKECEGRSPMSKWEMNDGW
jgi:glutathione peroxidase